MTNPGDIVRVRARRGGRASVYEANGWCQAFTDGLLEGVGVIPNTIADLNVLVGGTPTCPDVVLAKNPAGYRIALDLVGQQAVTITTPAANRRISSIVVYTDDLSLSTDQDETTGSPASCGLIVVNGAASASPTPPTDSEIRVAITADGATGSQACYGVIANITIAATTSTITNTLIDIHQATPSFKVTSQNIDWSSMKHWTPNYASKSTTNLVSNGTATITQTGFASIKIQGFASSPQDVHVRINDKDIWWTYAEYKTNNSQYSCYKEFVVPVAAGDVISADRWLNGVYFIPGKFA